jgi:hypothetical protein
VEDGMTRRYREIPAAEVPARPRLAAEDAVRFASVDLAIDVPEIRYFTDSWTTSGEAWAGLTNAMSPPPPVGSFEEPDGILGKAGSDDLVWLRADLGARRMAEVALHETLHVFQRRLVGTAQGRLEFDTREAQARTYEADLREIARAITTTEGAHDG